MSSSRPVSALPGVGPKREKALADVGIRSVLDLLARVPVRYIDQRQCLSLDDETLRDAIARDVGEVTVEGTLRNVRKVFTRRKGLNLVQGELSNDEGKLRCVWFNRPYLVGSSVIEGPVLLSGKLRKGRSGPELLNSDVSSAASPRRIIPQYAPVAGLGGKTLRNLMQAGLETLDQTTTSIEQIPAKFLARRELPVLDESLAFLHDPDDSADLEELSTGTTRAHQRLIYGDLFDLQCRLARASIARRGERRELSYQITDDTREAVRNALPFRLTGAQRRCLGEIVESMQDRRPMLRLLQGDVGCGKTIVAAMAALVAAESGHQTAFLSPTEVLAEQLAVELTHLLGHRHDVGLLTSSLKHRADVLSGLRSGSLRIVVGTHALIQEGVEFDGLALVVIDEQHRFGVDQRLAMAAKGKSPDVLLMSATPIPRSLALAVFGDLELSNIDELPPGREPVATQVFSDQDRPKVLRAVEEAIAADGRAFIVFPRIDESEASRVSLEKQGELYRKLAPGRVGILTGRTEAQERASMLDAFRRGDLAILLATTVVEVGIDVKEATLMVIEGAEHFGISQLHQLRGRVGRSSRKSLCKAVYSTPAAEATLQRLRSFESIHDGFELAELDLKSRGPGDLLGLEQSGFSQWTAERLANAVHWLEAAKEDAREWIGASDSGAGELLGSGNGGSPAVSDEEFLDSQSGTFAAG